MHSIDAVRQNADERQSASSKHFILFDAAQVKAAAAIGKTIGVSVQSAVTELCSTWLIVTYPTGISNTAVSRGMARGVIDFVWKTKVGHHQGLLRPVCPENSCRS